MNTQLAIVYIESAGDPAWAWRDNADIIVLRHANGMYQVFKNRWGERGLWFKDRAEAERWVALQALAKP